MFIADKLKYKYVIDIALFRTVIIVNDLTAISTWQNNKETIFQMKKN